MLLTGRGRDGVVGLAVQEPAGGLFADTTHADRVRRGVAFPSAPFAALGVDENDATAGRVRGFRVRTPPLLEEEGHARPLALIA